MTRWVLNENYIKSYMTSKKIKSITHLAASIGISPASLSLMMRHKRNPGQKTITHMIKFFDVSFETIFICEEALTNVNKEI